jgi:hypothetical protein
MKNLDCQCPVCKKSLVLVQSGNGLHYAICPTKSKKHILEIGPFKTEGELLKQLKSYSFKTQEIE